MTILPTLKSLAVAAALLASTSAIALAKDVHILVWAGGTGPNDVYRPDAIEIAAQ
ncbi:ABC transporter substrate-binding protein, partial [Rhizobium ruizarguesonis]